MASTFEMEEVDESHCIHLWVVAGYFLDKKETCSYRAHMESTIDRIQEADFVYLPREKMKFYSTKDVIYMNHTPPKKGEIPVLHINELEIPVDQVMVYFKNDWFSTHYARHFERPALDEVAEVMKQKKEFQGSPLYRDCPPERKALLKRVLDDCSDMLKLQQIMQSLKPLGQ